MGKWPSFFAVLFLFHCKIALATTIVPFLHLGELAQNSEAVLAVKALEQVSSKDGNSVYLDFKFEVETALKGPFSPGDELVVRPVSYQSSEISIQIHGDFQPQAGKIYLLFLNRISGHWKTVALSYYVLEEKTLGLERYWVPVDATLTFGVAPRADGQTAEPLGVYRRSELILALRRYVQNPVDGWSAENARTALTVHDFVQERAIPAGCDFSLAGGIARWFDDAVNIYYEPTNAPSNSVTTLSGAVSYMAVNYPGIAPVYAGTQVYSNPCTGSSAVHDALRLFLLGINSGQSALVMFNDPCAEISNVTVNASGGCTGTLAFGGSWAYTPTAPYDGQNWQRSGQGFVIVNDGVTDCTNIDAVQLLAHELTHVYSMGHLDASAYPGQNMNPVCCNAIGTKDIQCMNYAYLNPLPVDLTVFDAKKWRTNQVRLNWATASEKNNDHFFIERSADGLRFDRIVTVKSENATEGAHYAWIDERPLPGQNYYRLNQVDFDGKMYNHGIRAVRIGDARGGLEVYPNPLTEDAVKIVTAFETDYDGYVEIADLSGRVLERRTVQFEKGNQITVLDVPGLPSGIYWLRFYDDRFSEVKKFIKP